MKEDYNYKYLNKRKRFHYFENMYGMHYYGVDILFRYKFLGFKFSIWKNIYNHDVDFELSPHDNIKATLEGYKEFIQKRNNRRNVIKLKGNFNL